MKRILTVLFAYLFLLPNISAAYAVDSLTLCVKESGVVFAVGSGFHIADCKKNDKPITLTYGGSGGAGATGATGMAGATGSTGSVGSTGPTGLIGPIGPIGEMGNAGAQGIEGPVGATGIAGEIGTAGATGQRGMEGSVGANGATGDLGPTGATGANGVIGYELVTNITEVADTTSKTVPATCPAGKKVIGGGYAVTSDGTTFRTISDQPTSDDTWTVAVTRTSGTYVWSLKVTAICINAL